MARLFSGTIIKWMIIIPLKEMSVNVNISALVVVIVGSILDLALTLFLPGGTFRWIAGWLFLILFFGFVIIVSVWLLKHDPAFLQERLTGLRRPDQTAGDKAIMSSIFIFFIVWLVLMPLDVVRFQWSHMPVWIQAVGTIILILSFYLFFLVIRENPYLSPAIRVQKERGQTVVSTGPYHYIRHPYYSASILFFLGITLLLGSWYGLFPVLVLAGLIVIRALLEEKSLQRELKGYDIYMTQVKYRFIPYVW